MPRSALLMAALSGLVPAACQQKGAPVEPKRSEQRERPNVEDNASADAQKQPLRPIEPPSYAVVASVGTCAPPADGLRNVGACCSDQPCHGECVIEAGSKDTTCSCFGARGGCPEGEVCCKRTRSCTKLEACDWLP
jgi:hypothetical protein